MRFFYFILAVFISGCSGVAERVEKIEEPRLVILTEGIVGGISSPIVRQEMIFYQDAAGKCQVWTRKLKEAPFQFTYYFSDYSSLKFDQLLSELSGVKDLPLENPVAGEDIYQLDTSLGVFTENWQWMNQAPIGCVHAKSEVMPNQKQKKKFQEAVQQIKLELDALNLRAADKKSFEKISQQMWNLTQEYRKQK